ncbi:MAG: hypothetical protein KJ726_00290, partial [Verrucomicrobia bacterium]|nr:hypothetical protein [Verrucomicrobiota bacterium]
ELGREINAGVMVLDGYHFSRDYQARVRVFGAFPVMVLDDYAEIGGHDADLILDQNYGADVSLYGTSSRVGRFLLGTDYVLLRREFRLRRKTPRDVADRAGKILIAMGGSDPDNLSGKVIEVLRGLLDDGATFKVVAGPACPHLDVLRKRSGESAGRIDLIADSNDMPDLLAWADLVILAGGGTLWEALCMGCPVVSLARHPVQDVILGKMGKAGIIAYAGFAASLEMKAFQGEIIELVASRPRRAEMSRKGQQLIDGEGTSRVVRALFDMVSSKKTN